MIAGLSEEEASSADFQNSLRLVVADITGALPSDVIVTSVESASSSGTEVTIVYTVRSSSSDSTSLESSLLDSVTSGLMTELLVSDGYAGVEASEVPEVVVLTESPTPSPTPLTTTVLSVGQYSSIAVTQVSLCHPSLPSISDSFTSCAPLCKVEYL